MTLRMRIALLFTGLVVLILASFSVLVYLRLAREQARVFDELLANRATTAAIIALEKDELDAARYQAAEREFALGKLPDEHTSVVHADNTIIFSSDSSTAQMLVASMVMRQVRERGKVFADHHSRRVVYLLYSDNNQEFVVIASAHDTEGVATLRELLRSLVVGVLGVIVGVFAAGWLFARRMLAPVDAMTNLAEEISAHDLHKRLPEGNSATNDELSRLAHAFNQMFSRLEQTFAAQKQFIAHASHELRTPLTAIEGELEVALFDETLPPEAHAALSESLESTRQLRALVNNLLLLARAESGIGTLQTAQCSADVLVLEALERVQKRFAERVFSVHLPDDGEPVLVEGNAELLQIAMENLCENACKYSPAQSPVFVSLAALPDAVVLSIQDQGRGIAPEDQKQMFSPFFRSNATRDIQGTGIGLALVNIIAKQHGGTVMLQESSPQGSVFVLTLPRIVGNA
jgi:signal transduction histidine kinase